MKLLVEEWAQENLNENTLEIFRESIVCYKAGAYRSAYLMSYLAFKQTIRERILETSEYPNSFTEEEWSKIVISKLKDDNYWEGYLNKIVLQEQVKESKKGDIRLNEIFIYSNPCRIICRFKYWRDVRNSCAHAKSESINAATIEQFWSYLYDDLNEFYILGGKKYLMNKLIDSYKYYISEQGKNVDKLIVDIKSVYGDELKQFFEKFLDELKKVNMNLANENNVGFWKKIIFNKSDAIIKAFIENISEKKDIFLDFYRFFSSILQLVVENDSRFIQEYINPLLCRNRCDNSFLLNNSFWDILSSNVLYRDNIIDINNITLNIDNFRLINTINLDEYKILLLNEHKVFKSFILNAGKAFFYTDASSHWSYYCHGNPINDELLIQYFNLVEWDKELIEKIDTAYKDVIESKESRGNSDSLYNAEKRLNAYEDIVINNIEKIKKYCKNNNMDLSLYQSIIKLCNK